MHMNLTSIINKLHIFRAVLYAAFISSTLGFSISAYAQLGGGGGGGSTTTAISIETEFIKRQNVEERLQPDGDGLLGDSVDLNTGSTQFEQVDISIPGNSGLEVAIRRTRGLGFPFPHLDATSFISGGPQSSNPFSDWSLEVPRIAMVTENDTFSKTLCTSDRFGGTFVTRPGSEDDLSLNGPDIVWVEDYNISNGLDLIVPGQGSQKLLSAPQGINWPAGTIRVSKNNWTVKCGPADNGAQGFIATAPNGDVYKFNTYRKRYATAMPVHGSYDLGTWSSVVPRVEGNLLAGEVTDVNGNWVRYTYNTQGWLTRIHSNDGREILVNYDANDLIQTITANGRTWTYNYVQPQPGHTLLSSVTLPDGRQWQMNLINYVVTPNQCIDLSVPDAQWEITHPNGVKGTFVFSETRHLKGLAGSGKSRACITGVMQVAPYFDAMSLKSKTLSGPGYPAATWNYTYSGYTGGTVPSTKWGQVVGPLSRKTQTTYHRTSALEGLEMKTELFATAGASTPLQTSNYTYISENPVGTTWLENENPAKLTTPRQRATSVTTRDGDTFTTNSSYNTNQSSSSYSFGNPTSASVFSNVSVTPQTTVTTYENNLSKWILSLPKTVTTNGRNMATFTYDSLGRKTSQTRYGALQANLGYNADGTLAWAEDPLSRRTSVFDWKRGTPQRIRRPDLISSYQYVDNNGWLTSNIDANGNTTAYSHDNMGRLTTITPPTGWTPTTISYAFGTNIIQTINKGFAQTTVTYDSMQRPTLIKTTDSKPLVGSTSYVKTSYNALGQAVFTSFPSASSNPTTGTTTTYDALGRGTGTSENVTPFVTTSVAYLNLHRTRTTDPLNRQTTTSSDGYGGGVLLIEQPEDVNTQIYRNIWGQIDRVRQYGTGDGGYKDESHYYYYNTRQQLCRHFTQSGLGAVFAYDNAGQLTSYNRGVGSGSTCDTPAGNARVDLTYDDLGRVIDTNYTDANTPDISRVYDNNGNLTQLNRGIGTNAADWAYTYDNINNLTAEILSVDGGAKSFSQSYGYDADGFMTARALPSGRSLTLVYDGLGRMNKVSETSQIYAQNIDYHASGAITGMDYGNGQLFTQTLNARLQPARMLSQKGGTKALDLNYSYDVRGKVTGITNGAITGDNRTYNYDDMGRLTSATGPWGSSNYKYDVLGNIMEKKVGSRTIAMTYNATNRLTSHVDKDVSGNPIGGTTVNLSYDSHGNVTGLGAQQFKYDMAEQPYEILGAVTGDYVYDGNLKRVKAVVAGKTIYNVYDAGGTLVHVDEATDGNVTDYIGKIVRIKNGTPTWLHMDHLGSAQTGSSATGAITWREQYTPYGTTLTNPASNNDQAGFTGHIKDSATGLTYMQARYYDPLIGRFLSIDPVGFSVGQPQMFNRYSYVNNDPVNLIDPFGLCATDADGNDVGICTTSSATAELEETITTEINTTGSELAATESSLIEAGRTIYFAEGSISEISGDEVTGGLIEAVDDKRALVTIDSSDTIEISGVNTETGDVATRVASVIETVVHEVSGHGQVFAEKGKGRSFRNSDKKAVKAGNKFRRRNKIKFKRKNHDARLIQ